MRRIDDAFSCVVICLQSTGWLPLVLCIAFWLASAPSAVAAPPGPGWSIRSVAQPTNFTPGSDDRYVLVVTNVGSGRTLANAPITISDTLPEFVHAVSISGEDLKTQGTLACSAITVQCVGEDIGPGGTVIVTINVAVEPGNRLPECEPTSPGPCNTASVSGGGASSMTTVEHTSFSSEMAPFGIQDFSLQAFDADGSLSTQAGGHPYTVSTNLDFTSDVVGEEDFAPEQVKDVIVDLPAGLIGNPQSVPRCPLSALLEDSDVTGCPPSSRIGTVIFERAPGVFHPSEEPESETTGIYNLKPEPGFPAEFGFTFLSKGIYMYASAVRIDGQLRLRVTVPGVPELAVMGSTLQFFGNPAEQGSGTGPQIPFFTNPVDCEAGPLSATVEVDTWQHPASERGGIYSNFAESTAYPRVTGCNLLQFQPNLTVQADNTQADEPSGYTFTVTNPQDESSFQPGTPELKNATVTLPPGVSVSPSAADGLRACAATGEEGINIGNGQTLGPGKPGAGEDTGDPEATELGAGHLGGGKNESSPYDDGLYHTAPGHCPAASTIGTVEVTTPLLASPMEGHVYIAQPECGGGGQPGCIEEDALTGKLFKVYLEAAGSGSIVKLEGRASVNPATGQILASFLENPQVPFSSLKLHFNGGPRAPLANPQACGPATTGANFSAWSAPFTLDSQAFSSFTIDWDGAGGACPGALPLAPSLVAETADPTAGAFSPFSLTLSRADRQQYLSQLSVTMPPGLLAMISRVSLCGEPQAAAGTCPAASEIGTVTVAVGPGSHPYWVTGRVYLTGVYNGAPFGLSIVVPAQAGPFNLGEVVVRSAITVNPETSAVTITSAPLPQIIYGVPLRMQTVNVDVNRAGFIFNPTNCGERHVAVTVTGAQGAQADVSNPFAAAGCKSLPFSPMFTASTQAMTSKANGASLDVKVAYKPGQANIKSVAVTLPKQLPARLTTIQQACLAATFEANPAACPAGSLIGVAKASTPVLPGQLTGPAYLVSHGGAAFPDVVVILQGDGVRADLTGNINIAPKTEVTSSTFANIPDVPVTSFAFNLPEGSHSALAPNLPRKDRGDLCGETLTMLTAITGQNGLHIKQDTKVAVSGCPKVKAKTRKKRRTSARRERARDTHEDRG
jgi:hypothetical protein